MTVSGVARGAHIVRVVDEQVCGANPGPPGARCSLCGSQASPAAALICYSHSLRLNKTYSSAENAMITTVDT